MFLLYLCVTSLHLELNGLWSHFWVKPPPGLVAGSSDVRTFPATLGSASRWCGSSAFPKVG